MALKIGLALGSGASRGWAHIGVIRALEKYGIEPDIVCGCSVGAVVGAAYAASSLDSFEGWIRTLTRMEMAKYAELSFRSGLINKQRLTDGFLKHISIEGTNIQSLDKAFGAVATDLHSGREVWFTKGDYLTAIWSSMSLPGLFPPVKFEDKWLVDGGLVNPVPVSMCRSLGADVVIAVDLNGDIVGKHGRIHTQPVQSKVNPKQLSKKARQEDDEESASTDLFGSLKSTILDYSSSIFPDQQDSAEPEVPGFFDTISGSINIMQDRITRSRMAGDPPEVLLSPRLAHISLMEFYRAEEVIQIGYDVTLKQLDQIKLAVGE
ncbi:patatin-like phospholipase family protein [Leucothrix pacifica]|uniref:Patatin n=1 Tax=Leucothrix pacifica TaxID=1247513 RepID=A0A317CL28_9GAMM|nr:patatin-like phospholipase family protein [Leucothrix pacifica]PWQ99049.1 patatin [Leucothrix pacifica]